MLRVRSHAQTCYRVLLKGQIEDFRVTYFHGQWEIFFKIIM